jgi:hypothetical protein
MEAIGSDGIRPGLDGVDEAGGLVEVTVQPDRIRTAAARRRSRARRALGDVAIVLARYRREPATACRVCFVVVTRG